jgi:hypothetical protein
MAGKKKIAGSKSVAPSKARSLEVAAKGITTGYDFSNFMSALMSDLISGRVSPGVGNAACNAGGKLLKVVEMQMKYGTQDGNTKVLKLAASVPLVPSPDAVQ